MSSDNEQANGGQTTFEATLDLITGFKKSQIVHVAARLGLADHLRHGPKKNEEIAALIDLQAPLSLRLMRGLVWCGVVVQNEDGLYQLTDIGESLCTGAPGALHEVAIGSREQYPAWGSLWHTVQTGETSFNHVFDMAYFEYLAQHPDVGENFNRRMAGMTKRVAEEIVQKYDFANLTTPIDVAGGHGILISEILKANTQMNGILFDLPSVVEGAAKYLEEAGVHERCRVVGGSFFDSVPEGGNAYILKSILHDWDDDKSLQILHSCRRAMHKESKLLIIEYEMPERVDQSANHEVHMDLTMLVIHGGLERTRSQYESLLEATGFQLNNVIPIGRERIFEAVPV
ncbi:MAG: methyltransferase [Candidatus Latescibacteria bacterium]|nr:methyltransferase [Candidatus Latescibacterota bacterium]